MYRTSKLTCYCSSSSFHTMHCSLMKYIFNRSYKWVSQADRIRINCYVYSKTFRIEEGLTSPLFKNCEHAPTRFIMFFSTYFLCSWVYQCCITAFYVFFVLEFIEFILYDLYFGGIDDIDDEHDWRLWCFFPRAFPISCFFLWWRWPWRTRYSFCSIFDVYILLFSSCLNVRNWSLRLNEKKALYSTYYTYIYVLSDRLCRRV